MNIFFCSNHISIFFLLNDNKMEITLSVKDIIGICNLNSFVSEFEVVNKIKQRNKTRNKNYYSSNFTSQRIINKHYIEENNTICHNLPKNQELFAFNVYQVCNDYIPIYFENPNGYDCFLKYLASLIQENIQSDNIKMNENTKIMNQFRRGQLSMTKVTQLIVKQFELCFHSAIGYMNEKFCCQKFLKMNECDSILIDTKTQQKLFFNCPEFKVMLIGRVDGVCLDIHKQPISVIECKARIRSKLTIYEKDIYQLHLYMFLLNLNVGHILCAHGNEIFETHEFSYDESLIYCDIIPKIYTFLKNHLKQ